MLNYQSTSYHDAASLRRLFHLRPTPEFATWLETRGIFQNGQIAAHGPSIQHNLLQQATVLLP
jgi:ethanolamine ammonia-lyase large subunit